MLLCYFCAFWVCVSPFINQLFQWQTDVQLYLATVAIGTPLAAIGVLLNHLAEKSPKKQ